MKAGIAAMLLAAKSLAKKIPGTPGIVLVLTAAEEGGCIGSYHLAQTRLLGSAGAMIVGEPTSNYPYVGHKGSLKFYAGFRGTSAHGSMPELGVNAIYKAARAVSKLEAFDFAEPAHPVMGRPTLNVGTFEGGHGVNMVPAAARAPDRRVLQHGAHPPGGGSLRGGHPPMVWNLRTLPALLLALVATASPAQGVTRIVVPFAAGGVQDILARSFNAELGALLGA